SRIEPRVRRPVIPAEEWSPDMGSANMWTEIKAGGHMAAPRIRAVREHLAKLPPSSSLTLAERRAQYDRAERVFPTPADVAVETVEAPERPAEWLTPPAARADAVVLYFHGGGYAIGSPRSHRHLAAAIARAADTRVPLLDYRLAPEHPFPAALDDAVEAYQWLLARGLAPG